MRGADFRDALAGVLTEAAARRVAIMCSESVWWRCHRRLVADALVVRGQPVRHIGPDGGLTDHALTDFAVVADGTITYPPAQIELVGR